MFKDCVIDACVTASSRRSQMSSVCEAYRGMAEACAEAGISSIRWRSRKFCRESFLAVPTPLGALITASSLLSSCALQVQRVLHNQDEPLSEDVREPFLRHEATLLEAAQA